jgi:4-oxalomesaconate hydratase
VSACPTASAARARKLWKQDGMTLDEVKAAPQGGRDAAKALNVHDIRFFDLGDYPLDLDASRKDRMVDLIRAVQPAFMMSHSKWDPYNTDHMYTTEVRAECRMIAQAWGHNPGEKVLGAPQLYLFEPHQTEQMGWKPDVFLDITEVWDKKRAAIECMQGQDHLWDFYRTSPRTGATTSAGTPAGRRAGAPARYAEGFPVDLPAHGG